jgi:murein DD-endopeptidase MepM/ murein hydrolase activator NlpD
VVGVLFIGGRPDAAAPLDPPAALQPDIDATLTAAPEPLVLVPAPSEAEALDVLERGGATSAPLPDGRRLELRVARGDTLERMFRRHELSVADMFLLLRDDQARRHLSILRPGDVITVEHEAGRVLALRRELDEIRVLEVTRSEDAYRSSVAERAVETRVVTAHAVIDSSLFNAGRAAGVPDSVTMGVAGMFQWDVDFALDIREGDRFSVVYQELWRDGQRLRPADILAAEFVNRGRTHRAVRFEMDDRADYYTPEGRSVRKAFIRAPVDFARISSRFNPNRRHPVLHTIRAHRGVDYAAATGTPIKAAGDGRVIFRGVQGGYGNTIILQHGGNITTLYAHMSRFHADVRQGSRVRQGQVIGYVGMSGLATGPHLHYEYRVNGVHRDPLTVELPPAEPIPAQYRERFHRETAPLLAYLQGAQEAGETRLAMSGR